MTTYHNMAFQGGGASGLAYIGAISELEELETQKIFSFKDIWRVAGTSVGSITALLVSLNYSSEEIAKFLTSINLNKLKGNQIDIIGDLHRLDHQYGFYNGDALLQLIKKFLKEKTGNENATFGDLKKQGFKDLYVIATKIYKRDGSGTAEPVVFSFENSWNTCVAPIILASASIPGFFNRVRLKQVNDGEFVMDDKEGHAYADGGLFDNFPIDIFDNERYLTRNLQGENKKMLNPETLGMCLRVSQEIADLRDGKATEEIIPDGETVTYFGALLNGLTSSQQDYKFQDNKEIERSIFIDRLNTKATDFNMSDQKKNELIYSGKKSVFDFFEKQYKNITPINDSTIAIENKSENQLKNKKFANCSQFWKKTAKEENVVKLESKQQKPSCQII